MTITKEQRVPRGRPKIHNFETKQEYFRNYYKKNRAKFNTDYMCPTCELYCSFANKSRHAKSKFHLDRLAKCSEPNSEPDSESNSESNSEPDSESNSELNENIKAEVYPNVNTTQ
jgi:hypothetical protein